MPTEAEQSKLDQPWKAWHTDLYASKASDSEITTIDEKSTHGTVALNPRTDVDLKDKKVRPNM